jgi:hypothetical protein
VTGANGRGDREGTLALLLRQADAIKNGMNDACERLGLIRRDGARVELDGGRLLRSRAAPTHRRLPANVGNSP